MCIIRNTRKVKYMLTNEEKNMIDEKLKDFVAGNLNFPNKPIDIIKFATNEKNFIVQSLYMSKDTSGMMLYNNDDYVAGTNSHGLIVIKRGLSEKESRFIVAHELGHYCLNADQTQIAHREKEEVVNKSEEMAEYFARCILMPIQGLKNLIENLKNFDKDMSDEKIIEIISIIFNVTEKKARIRFSEI